MTLPTKNKFILFCFFSSLRKRKIHHDLYFMYISCLQFIMEFMMTPETSASNEINWFLRKVSVYVFFFEKLRIVSLNNLGEGFL